ncbi:MAG TPA: ubiquinol-cytochrome C chaperone family protein [Sphingomicrobium sp.]
MLRLLFPRLTAHPARGAALSSWVTARARQPHWYVEGGVPDTVDGRFAMLATVAALVLVRLEQEEAGADASVALTERFVEAMEAEHREMGLGDPKLGRTVRKLVGSLAGRVDLWRATIERDDWATGAHQSLYRGGAAPQSVAHSAAALRGLWVRLTSAPLEDVASGRIE